MKWKVTTSLLLAAMSMCTHATVEYIDHFREGELNVTEFEIDDTKVCSLGIGHDPVFVVMATNTDMFIAAANVNYASAKRFAYALDDHDVTYVEPFADNYMAFDSLGLPDLDAIADAEIMFVSAFPREANAIAKQAVYDLASSDEAIAIFKDCLMD